MGLIKKKTAARGTEGGSKWVCDSCSVDITSTVRIKCDVCPDYDLCVPCFAEGKKTKDHEPQSHPFKVIEQHSIPIYTEDWGADEELALIEGAETYGLGSWADIADHIGGYRYKDEVRDHYINTYVKSSNFPLPERSALNDTRLSDDVPREEFQARKKRRIEQRKEAAKTASPGAPKQKPTASQPACHEVAGFMPGRLEFETEYFNEAEEAVQHMQFEPGDGINPRTGEIEPEMELKLKIMEIYNSRLTQRVERKKIIFEHELLEYKRNQAVDKKRSKEEKELYNRVKPFARMMTHKDFEEFYDGLAYELNLRQAISQLQEWRKGGIDDLAAGEKYEKEKEARQARGITISQFDRLASTGLRKPVPPPEQPSLASMLVGPELPAKYQPGATGLHTPPGSESPTSKPTSEKVEFVIPAIPGCTSLDLNDENASDRHLLPPAEMKLCSTLRIFPKPYMMIKAKIIQAATINGGTLKKKQVREICNLENTKGNRLYEFFVQAGWIAKGTQT
ncbi:transcriptional adaptor 2 [Rhizodiscina lignyota]|uniref:Transcriptional adapter 2 n=1 Tax=Rhizodiscina lignyota TaxID=1504668 RepID=A0A9P4M670_9PEZI|nr:transcriptional adaptor 2 [Rhizodiscina lignyota]